MSMRKRLTALTLSAIMVLGVSTSVMANEIDQTPITVNEASTSVDGVIKIDVDGVELPMDTAPIMAKEDVFVPFSAFFKAIGAETSYESSTKTATVIKNNTVASFVVGRNDVIVKRNGNTNTFIMDNAPFISNDLVYIPAEWAGKSLGYSIGYDGSMNTMIMVDVAKMVKPYQDQFKIMDKYMAYSKKFSQSSYQFTGNYSGEMKMEESYAMAPIKLNGKLSGLTNSIKGDMDMTMNMDIKDFLKTISGTDASADPEMKKMVDLLSNLEMNIRFDLEAGKYYFKSSQLSRYVGINENVWFEVDLNEIYGSLGFGNSFLSQILKISQNDSFTQTLTDMLTLIPISSKQDVEALNEMLNMTVKMFGDDAFSKEGDQYISHYKQSQSGVSSEIKFAFTVNDGNQVIGYDITVDMNMGEYGSMGFLISQDKNNAAKLKMTMDVPNAMSLVFDLSMQMKQSTVKPYGVPSGNDRVIPFYEMPGF